MIFPFITYVKLRKVSAAKKGEAVPHSPSPIVYQWFLKITFNYYPSDSGVLKCFNISNKKKVSWETKQKERKRSFSWIM